MSSSVGALVVAGAVACVGALAAMVAGGALGVAGASGVVGDWPGGALAQPARSAELIMKPARVRGKDVCMRPPGDSDVTMDDGRPTNDDRLTMDNIKNTTGRVRMVF